MTTPSTIDYSHGFGGRYGIEKDKRDKAALGYDYKGETEKHESQRGELGWRGGRSHSSIEPSFLPFWKLTERTQNTDVQMCSGGGGLKGKCMYVGGETRRMERKTARLGEGQRMPKRRGH